MELFKFNTSNYIELSTSKINEEIFIKIKDKIILTLKKLDIPNEGMSIYYERHNNSSSILAIKLANGDDLEVSNYMINSCITNYYNNKPSCDIGFHANNKVGQSAMYIANMIAKDIIIFFENLEKDLFIKNLSSSEFSLRISLDNQTKKLPSPKESKFKTKIRRAFHK